jgi:hypothetical protein
VPLCNRLFGFLLVLRRFDNLPGGVANRFEPIEDFFPLEKKG